MDASVGNSSQCRNKRLPEAALQTTSVKQATLIVRYIKEEISCRQKRLEPHGDLPVCDSNCRAQPARLDAVSRAPVSPTSVSSPQSVFAFVTGAPFHSGKNGTTLRWWPSMMAGRLRPIPTTKRSSATEMPFAATRCQYAACSLRRAELRVAYGRGLGC